MHESDSQTQETSSILRCPRAFSQVSRWHGLLWCPAATAIRDQPGLCLSQIPKGTSYGTSPKQGSVWDQTLLWRSRIICSEEKTPVDRGECWTVSALTQPLFHVARTPSVTDPFPVPSLDIPTVFLSYPVLYSNSGQNQTSKFRASLASCGAQEDDFVVHNDEATW